LEHLDNQDSKDQLELLDFKVLVEHQVSAVHLVHLELQARLDLQVR
jgi:hypothetical protein